MTSSLEPESHAPLVFSVSLAVFDLHLGNSISYTHPLPAHGTPEPIQPSNILGGANIHDYCFPDGSHDQSSDSVAFLVRLVDPLCIDRDGKVILATPTSDAQSQPQQRQEDVNNRCDDDVGVDDCHDGKALLRAAVTGNASPLLLVRKDSDALSGGFLDQPQALLFGTALYVRAADSAVERGALQRAMLVLTRVPLHRPVVDLLKLKVLPILSDSSYGNTDPRLTALVDKLYRELCVTFAPCLSSFRHTQPLFTELGGGQRVFLPRVGRLQNPASDLVLLGFRSSVVSLLRMLGPTHSALLLFAIISRMPVIVIGRTAAEVGDAVTAAIHLCRPLPIDISHFAPYAPITVLDKLVASATEESDRKKRAARMAAAAAVGKTSSSSSSSSPPASPAPADSASRETDSTQPETSEEQLPVAIIGATNAFIAHKQFEGVCKLILPSLAEEVAMSSNVASSGSGDSSTAASASSRGPNAATVQYPASSLLHKKGPSAFLPRTLFSRVKALVAIANEADASEIHVRSLVLALNFALSLEIKTNYGDVGAAFAVSDSKNIVTTPLTGGAKPPPPSSLSSFAGKTPSSPARGGGDHYSNIPKRQQQVKARVAEDTDSVIEQPEQQKEKPEESNSGFDIIDSDVAFNSSSSPSPTRSGAADASGSPQTASPAGGSNNNNNNNNVNLSKINTFPAISKSRSSSDESKLIHSLELALQSFVAERAQERKTVMSIHRWFSAVRSMLGEVAACSDEQQRLLFDGLMSSQPSADSGRAQHNNNFNGKSGKGNDQAASSSTFATGSEQEILSAVQRDVLNLHRAAEDVGNYLTGEDMLLTVGEQQRLNRLDLARFVEHYRRRAGAAVDILCNSKSNRGARSRPDNELFCDVFSLPGIECYEMMREVLLAQTASTVVQWAPCEGPEHSDKSRPPKPFWEGVDATVSLSSRFLCFDATNQTIGSKAMSNIAKLFPKTIGYYDQRMVNGFFAHQVVPIAAVSRIEVIEAVNMSGGNILTPLTSTVIPRDLHTLRLHLCVDQSNSDNKSLSNIGNLWRAKIDLRLAQKSGVSQLLFLIVNERLEFEKAIKKLTESSSLAKAAAAAASPPSTDAGADSFVVAATATVATPSIEPGHFFGQAKGTICPVFLGPARLRDIAAITSDEVYENERNYPIIGWSKKLLPHDPPAWSDRSGVHPRTKEGARLPPGYEWASEWCLLPYYEGRVAPPSFEQEFVESMQSMKSGKWAPGDECWCYGTFWQLADFHAAAFPLCSIRRRRWVRQRRLIAATKGGMSVTRLQEKRDEEAASAAVAAAKMIKASSPISPTRSEAAAAAASAAGSNSATSPHSISPDRDLNNSMAFASHLSSMEEERVIGGSHSKLKTGVLDDDDDDE